jgi:hypothetical protein
VTDHGRAPDELVNLFAKRTDVALKRLRDQRLGKRLELGVEHGLEPTPTLLALRAVAWEMTRDPSRTRQAGLSDKDERELLAALART